MPSQQVRYAPTDVGHTFTKTANQKMGESTQPVSTDSSNTTNVELVKRLGPAHRDAELSRELNRRGLLTGLRRPFDEAAVRWVRYAYGVPSPPVLAPNELSVRNLAVRLGVSEGVVYYWIERNQLAARRGPGNRLCVPFSPEVEQACRERIARSSRIVPRTQGLAVGAVV